MAEYASLYQKLMMSYCLQCNELFIPNKFTPFQKFCSAKCRIKKYYHDHFKKTVGPFNHERVCHICNKVFYGRITQKYCSNDCKNKAIRIKYKNNERRRVNIIKRTNKRNDIDRYNLGDNYIKKLLTKRNKLNHKDIPQSLINAYREYLKLRRIIKKPKLKGEQYVKHS